MSPMVRFALPLALALVAATARADDAWAPTPPAKAPGSYRLQIAAADVAGLGLLAAGDALESSPSGVGDPMMAFGLGTYIAGGPVIHLAHGEGGRAGISLAARLVLPMVGGAIGASMASCSPNEFLCGLSEIGAGMFVGGVVASVLDVGVIAPSYAPPSTPERAARRRLAPSFMATHNRAVIGLGGSF